MYSMELAPVVEFEGDEPPSGLFVARNFISTETHDTLVRLIEGTVPFQKMADIVGYDLGGFNKRTHPEKKIPDWLQAIIDEFVDGKIFEAVPSEILILRYRLGRGISSHTDASRFGDTVVGISLKDVGIFEMRSEEGHVCRFPLFPGDAYMFRGPARYDWKHGTMEGVDLPYKGTTLTQKQGRMVINMRDEVS